MTEALFLANPTATTTLAARLNAAMASSLEAQIDYLETWGVEWQPLGCGVEIHDGASTTCGTVR